MRNLPAPRIRPAAMGDAAEACAVIRRSITECCVADHRHDSQLLDAWLRNKTVASAEAWIQDASSHCVVAELDTGLVGFAMARGDRLLLCYVLPEVRFQGVGKALLSALEAGAAVRGVSVLQLDSTRSAEDFYRRNGFEAIVPRAPSAGLEGLRMAKTIPSSVALPT